MLKLQINSLSLSYNHSPVVKDLSFTLQPGELVGIIGPNGCGKTSIIKALSRVLTPRSGQILLEGKNLQHYSRSELARLIGVVPQNPSLPETFTVADMVLLGRNPHLGLLRNESLHDLEICWQAMQKTGISHLAERRLGELSGGERQRVTLARVLAQEPRIILLDEPTANLDISHQIEIFDLVKYLCRENNLLVLIALHDLNLASQYCDRLILLKEGQLHVEGTPQQVITTANIKEVYGTVSQVYPHPENSLPVVLIGGNKNHHSPASQIAGNGKE